MFNKENLGSGGEKKKTNTDGSQVSAAELEPVIEWEYCTISKEKKIKS